MLELSNKTTKIISSVTFAFHRVAPLSRFKWPSDIFLDAESCSFGVSSCTKSCSKLFNSIKFVKNNVPPDCSYEGVKTVYLRQYALHSKI